MKTIEPDVSTDLIDIGVSTVTEFLALSEDDESAFANAIRRIVDDVERPKDIVSGFQNYV